MPSLRREKECPTCGGTGRIGKTVCSTCRGEGVVAESERIRIKIPEGTLDGGTVRIPGKGGPGHRGGPPGDLYVTVRVAPDERFERQGEDLLHVRKIAFTQAALGTHLDIDTLEGLEELLVPPGTQPGHVFRLKGRGIPALRGRGRGDLLVRVDIEVPGRLSAEEDELIRSLAGLRGEDVAAASDKGVFSRLRSAFQ